MPQAGIDLASAANSTDLIAAVAGQHWWADVTMIPSDTGEFELLSGSTVIWHSQVGATGGQYFASVNSLVAGDALVLRRVGTLAMGGHIQYRVK